MKKTNALIITRHFYPKEGGIETYMYQVAKNWDKGVPTVLCFQADDEPLRQREPFHIVRYPEIPLPVTHAVRIIVNIMSKGKKTALFYKLFLILLINRYVITNIGKLLQEAYQILKKSEDNWIVQCSKPMNAGVLGLVLKVCFGYPYIVYIHGTELLTLSKKKNNKKLFDMVLNYADLVISNSKHTKRLAQNLGVNKEIKVINLGADTTNFYPKKRNSQILEKYKIPENAKILLTISHLIPRKGHDQTIRALNGLIKRNPEIHYLIVGKGPNLKYLQDLAQKQGVDDNVHFCGFVPNDELVDYMNTCDIFVMPNREEENDVEGFGIVFLEANACKKPVIGGDSGGVPDAIIDGETGYLVDPYDSDDIAEKIEELVNNPKKCKAMGEAGFKRVQESANWNSVCSQINKLIDKEIQ